MSRSSSLVSLYLAAQPLLLNILSLPAMAYIVRSQGEVNYGQWQTAMTITGTLGVLSHLGLRPYFVRAVAQDPGSAGTRLGAQLGLRLLLALVGAVLSIAACLVLGYSSLVLACTAVAATANVIASAGYCFADVLEGLEKFLAYTNAAFASGIALIISNVLVCLSGLGPVALSCSYLVGPIVTVLAMGVAVSRHTPIRLRLDLAGGRALLREARHQSRAVLLGAFEDRAEPLLLPKVSGYADTGYFAAGNIPASRLVSVPYGLSSFYFPKLARRHAAGRNLDETITHLITLLLLVTLPATLGVSFLADWMSQILFPENPARCAAVMRVSAWSLPLAALGSGLMTVLQASGRIDRTARIELVSILLGFAVTVVFVVPGGVYGAAWSWVVRSSLNPILLFPMFWGPFRRGLFAVPWGRLLLACGGMQGAFVLAERFGQGPAEVWLGGAIAGTIAFLGILSASGVLVPRRVQAMLSGGVDP
jgi:O-antigen/teichoic acid export membrane protein